MAAPRTRGPSVAADNTVVRFCPNCGNQYAHDSAFCRRCGEKRDETRGQTTFGGLSLKSRANSVTPRKLSTHESFLDAEHGTGLMSSPTRGMSEFLQKIKLHLAEAEDKIVRCTRHVDEAWSKASHQMSLFDTRLGHLDSYLTDLALQQRTALAGLDTLPGKASDRIAQLELRLEECMKDALQQRQALAGLDALPGKTSERIARLEVRLDECMKDALQQRHALAGLDALPGKTSERIAQLEVRLDEFMQDVKAASRPQTNCPHGQLQQVQNEERETELDLIRLRVEALSERLSSEARVREEQFRRLEILIETLNIVESPQKEGPRTPCNTSPLVPASRVPPPRVELDGSAAKHCTQENLATVPVVACSNGDVPSVKDSSFGCQACAGEASTRLVRTLDSSSMISTQTIMMPAPPVSARGSRPLVVGGISNTHLHYLPATRACSQPPAVARHAEQACHARSRMDSTHVQHPMILNQRQLEYEQQRVFHLQLPRHCP
eukprot:TRINITY_DN8881_c0_g1_i2.p1 TRINITY_DN8881_c0_g1~~TRINITY_DN8881_c0_g1_i2.p1  ORF type:complete len:495 (-),score=80.73 TRINITY_DN8881_c0_g1_i2:507-1991(-)